MSTPSFEHEGYVRLFKDRPELAVELLRDIFGVELGTYTEMRAEPGEITDIKPAKRYADLVTQFIADGKPVRALIVEVQLDAAAVSVTLEDAIDAGDGAGKAAAPSSATSTADPPSSANAPTPPAAPAPAPAAPAPPPTRTTGCAGCSAGRAESDVGLWLAAVLLGIGLIARRR